MPVFAQEVPLATAREIPGVRAMFGEAYPDPVRVVSVGIAVEELVAMARRGNGEKKSENGAASSSFDLRLRRLDRVLRGHPPPQHLRGGAFALISEEGVAKGIRRVVAITGDAAASARRSGAALEAAAAAAEKTTGKELVDALVCSEAGDRRRRRPAAAKAGCAWRMAALSKRAGDESRKAAAAAAGAASDAAVAAPQAAVAAGEKFLTLRLDDALGGTQGGRRRLGRRAEGRAGAPGGPGRARRREGQGRRRRRRARGAAKAFPAGEWLKAALDPSGGKGGGKPTMAQGQAVCCRRRRAGQGAGGGGGVCQGEALRGGKREKRREKEFPRVFECFF